MESSGLRTFIAILLCMATLLIWQLFFSPKPKMPVGPNGSTIQQEIIDAGDAKLSSISREKKSDDSGITNGFKNQTDLSQNPVELVTPEKVYRIEADLWSAEFSDRGAALKSFLLKKYHISDEDTRPVDMVHPGSSDQILPLSIIFHRSSQISDTTGKYELSGQDRNFISFKRKSASLEIEKIYKFKPDEYVMDLSVTIRNISEKKIAFKPLLAWLEKPKIVQKQSSWFSSSPPDDLQQATCLVNEKLEKMEAGSTPVADMLFEGRVEWTGLDSRYFLTALMPESSMRTACVLAGDQAGDIRTSLMYQEMELLPDAVKSFSYRIFIGPKDYNLLKTLKSGLDKSVDFGWFSILCIPMLWLLRLFNSAVGNWGIAIILLTIVIKVVSLPLTQKSYKSMNEMAKLKPKLEEIQKKYKADRQKLNEEMIHLYRQHGISPLSGCLPMLLQMPIWIALYRMLYSAVELYQAPFIRGWTDNLAAKDPTYILPILLGIGMFVQQKLTPTTMDSAQAKMMLYFMPIFFTLIMLSLPSGLTLYIFVNTILSIVHQLYNNKQAKGPVAATAK